MKFYHPETVGLSFGNIPDSFLWTVDNKGTRVWREAYSPLAGLASFLEKEYHYRLILGFGYMHMSRMMNLMSDGVYDFQKYPIQQAGWGTLASMVNTPNRSIVDSINTGQFHYACDIVDEVGYLVFDPWRYDVECTGTAEEFWMREHSVGLPDPDAGC